MQTVSRTRWTLADAPMGAAGVGANTQDSARCGQLVRCLSRHHTAEWCVLAANDLDSPALLVHSAVPPMHACLALPQPLRWFMGRWAKQMNQILAEALMGQVGRTMHWHPETTTTAGMAVDGIHPSSEGYAVWADGLSRCILAAHDLLPGRAEQQAPAPAGAI